MSRSTRHDSGARLFALPVMSLAAVLVPLLAMGAEFAHVAVVETTLPAMCGCGVGGDPEPTLSLTLFVHDWGVEVAGNDPELEGRRSFEEPQELAAFLAQLKARHPHEGQVVVVPDARVSYGEVVRAMDAARGFEGQQLFPWPVLAGPAL